MLESFVFCDWNASQVFSMTMATVIGPIPPGTVLIYEAIGETSSKYTSPQAFPHTKVQPTSITTAHDFTYSRVISPGFPAATIRISAVFVISLRSLVFELQIVTVAHALIAMRLIGFPTILDRPIMTTFFPISSIL